MAIMEKSEGSVVLVFCAALALSLGAALAGRPAAAEHEAAAPEVERPVSERVAEGTQGAVSAAAPEASAAGLAVLEEGGNAADALVAASFVMAVVRPQSTGIGGGGFALYHDARGGDAAYDGRERAPAEASEDMYLDSRGNKTRQSLDGARAAGVPGLVAMLAKLHAEHGSKKVSWARLVQPAIDLAEQGVRVTPSLARAIAERKQVLEACTAARALFLPDGRPLAEGDLLRQPDLARTLKAIAARGAPGFYEGEVARALVQATRAAGGHLSDEDLRGYQAVARDPVRGTYRGYQVISMPPPSAGGVLLIEMLNVLSNRQDLGDLSYHGGAHVHLLAETMRRAYADRSELFGDPDAVRLPTARLLTPEYAAALYRGIDPAHATPSSAVRPGQAGIPEGPHTTHISVVDAAGNACSSTQTVNLHLGSAFVAAGTGVLLNNEMDDFATKPGTPNAFGLVQGRLNAIAPGRRPVSSMTPTIVLDREGKVFLVLGSPGGSRITTAVLQVLSNVIDFGMSLDQAIEAPRLHHQWLADELVLERGFDGGVVQDLAARGHIVRVLTGEHDAVGEVEAVLVRPDGERVAATDPRGEGTPAAY
jgi:gamma-glutamyltranspeptidase/glutathione hydrolase